ncbi:MAG TPA: type II secretion system protein GspM [Candidatus Binatia bacterium]|nr:type II secretion system protein GspM [Candidatus Binatia bacterium]
MNRFWQRLSKRERSLVIVTLAIIVVVLARYLLIGPFVERREWVKAQLEIQPQLLEKNLRFLGQKDELVALLEATQSELKAREPRLLTGDTPSVSASDLQDVIQGLATKEGTQVITTRVLNPETAGSFAKISVQMEIGGQIDQLASLIRGIENSPKLLMVDEINVRSLFRPVGFPQPQRVPQLATQNLRVSLRVSGLARSQASAATQSDSALSQSKGNGEGTSEPSAEGFFAVGP